MVKFKHYDYNQMSMVVINYLEQIQPVRFEFALHYLISEKLDLSVFHKPYRNDADDRPVYDPAICICPASEQISHRGVKRMNVVNVQPILKVDYCNVVIAL